MHGPMKVKHMKVKESAYNIYRSSVLEQIFLCPTPHYVYEFKVSKNDITKKNMTVWKHVINYRMFDFSGFQFMVFIVCV
jgi:hypothetical protein